MTNAEYQKQVNELCMRINKLYAEVKGETNDILKQAEAYSKLLEAHEILKVKHTMLVSMYKEKEKALEEILDFNFKDKIMLKPSEYLDDIITEIPIKGDVRIYWKSKGIIYE